MADACMFLMENNISNGIYNIGSGSDVSIKRLAEVIMKTVGFRGDVVFDTSKPDGTPRKWLDVSRMKALGWHAQVGLEDGIKATYYEYVKYVTQQRHFYREVTTHIETKADL
jgi:GDP-L-fucose synthase